ncbi:MAG: aminotransferase class III-fold pyridoxal phosphate-dependent enzyme [Solirubrobacterales bacterium]
MTVAASASTEELYRRHLSAGRVRLASLLGGHEEVSSSGAIVNLASGGAMLQCGGYGVFLLGHSHPRVVAAVRDQLERHALSSRLLLDPTQALAAAALASVAPAGLDRVYFGTSGADAVEAALKLARMHGKRRIVSADAGFHGKTLGALSASGNPVFREPFTPLLPDVAHVPFADADAIAAELAAHPGQCCVILEPVQGEGGVNLPGPTYLSEVGALCREHEAVLILDEIATGLGRVGSWWGCDRYGVSPDAILVGKALSGGVVPVSAVVASSEMFAPLDRDPFIHSATFSGAPIAMAAVASTVEVLTEEGIPERADELGSYLLAELGSALAEACSAGLVREVRGAGLLIGIEFASPALAGNFEIELVSRNVIPNHCLNNHGVVRLTPPALLSDDEVRWLIHAVSGAAAALLDDRRSRAAGN